MPDSRGPPYPTAPIRRIVGGLVMLAVIVGMAVLGYMLAGWSLIDALYMVVITIFGVGYGEVRPIETPGMKIFTITLIVAGCSAGLWVIGGLVEFMAEGRILQIMGKRRMCQQIEELEGHAIVCGYGRVGQMLCRELTGSGMPLVVVDSSPQRLAEAEAAGLPVITGDAADEETLRAAKIDSARVVAVVLPDDAANVFVTLSARELSASVEIIARGEKPETERKLLRSGANRVVLPTAAGASRIARMILSPSAEHLLADAAQLGPLNEQLREIGLEIGEVRIDADGPVGVKLAGLEIPASILVVAIRRPDGEVRRQPHPTTLLEEGDTLLLVGRREDLPRSLRKRAASPTYAYRGATRD